MRAENEWFKPEKLRAYYFLYVAVALAVVLLGIAVLAYTGVLAEMEQWVLLVGGAVLVVAFGYLAWWIPAFYRSADYRLAEGEIDYRRGVFFQHKSTVPYDRITNVDAAQGPAQRLVGAGQVGVHTAGYAGQVGAELTIAGVSDYEEIKDQILAKVRGRSSAATESGEAGPTPQPGAARSDEQLVELRRIRELLERGGSA